MKSTAIRAIYEEGHLRLLDSVNLKEGEEIELLILSDRARVQAALQELLVQQRDDSPHGPDDNTLQEQIEADSGGQLSLSDAILQERHEGP